MSRNLIFISHCNFHGNSSFHLFSIANVLADLGHSCAVCVPDKPETVFDLGRPRFQTLSYEEALLHGVSFANDRPPDLVHAWTPREAVRRTAMALVQRYKVPYFVHLEDNEIAVLLDELPGWSLENLERLPSCALDALVPDHRVHPHRWREMLAGAAGVTALIDRLLEFKPANTPGMVFFPGYRPEFAKIDGRDDGLRVTLGITPDELLLVYTGNVHNSNFREVRSLVLAIALLNRRGIRAKLIKTGSDFYALPELSDPKITQYLIELGFVPHSEVPRLLAAADVLVQPGSSNQFNDYRFPSKLPEFLVSGRPVALPRSNVGLLLKDGEQALVLSHGHSADIADALKRLGTDPQLRAKIGHGGREFALYYLNWEKNAAAFPYFYDRCLSEERRSTSAGKAEEPAVPKVITFYLPQFHLSHRNDVYGKEWSPRTNALGERTKRPRFVKPQSPSQIEADNLDAHETIEAEVALARRFKVFGFCFYYYWFNGRRLLTQPLTQFLERTQLDFPFCVCWANENWSRYWRGQEREALIKQEYRDDFSVKFIRDIIPILKDPRHIKVHGDPVLMIHRVSSLPDPSATAEIWRAECRKAGLSSLHLIALQTVGIHDPRPFGFDAAVEFSLDTYRAINDARSHSGGIGPLAQTAGDYTLYRCVTASRQNPPLHERQIDAFAHSSSGLYRASLRRAVAHTMALAEAQAPLIFVNSWNNWAEEEALKPSGNCKGFLEDTHSAWNEGFADYLKAVGAGTEESIMPNLPMLDEERFSIPEPGGRQARHRYKTENWLNDEQLKETATRYRNHFVTTPLSYATVRDYCDSVDHLPSLAIANQDLKDNQRPWVMKVILSLVRPGGRILEIGAGEPFVADILDRLGYEVWVVDPYDGTGNGPVEYERFRNECPNVRFVRSNFDENLLSAPPSGFDCIYSISVLEHIPAPSLNGVFAGIRQYLRPAGYSVHAIDHVHKGREAEKHYENLKTMVQLSGFEEARLARLLKQMDEDPETYYLSAESHNRWRGSLPYDEFPMRVCVSIQIISTDEQLRVPNAE